MPEAIIYSLHYFVILFVPILLNKIIWTQIFCCENAITSLNALLGIAFRTLMANILFNFALIIWSSIYKSLLNEFIIFGEPYMWIKIPLLHYAKYNLVNSFIFILRFGKQSLQENLIWDKAYSSIDKNSTPAMS